MTICKFIFFSSFRDDIVFKDPLNTFVGIEDYKSIFWALGFHGRMFLKASTGCHYVSLDCSWNNTRSMGESYS